MMMMMMVVMLKMLMMIGDKDDDDSDDNDDEDVDDANLLDNLLASFNRDDTFLVVLLFFIFELVSVLKGVTQVSRL